MDEMFIMILIGAIFLLVGILLGAVFGNLLGSRDGGFFRQKEIEEIRILRDKQTQKLILDVDNEIFHDVEELDKDQKKHLALLWEELHQWLNLPDIDFNQRMERILPVDSQAPDESTPSEMDTAIDRQKTASTMDDSIVTDFEEQVKPVSMNPITSFIRAVQADAPKIEIEPKSIAFQVNEILQEKLEGTRLKDRAIRLMEFPEKGMVVLVGLDQYESVEDVPDEEIRIVLRESVSEWEKKAE